MCACHHMRNLASRSFEVAYVLALVVALDKHALNLVLHCHGLVWLCKASVGFGQLFEEMEQSKNELGILSFGISVTTIEEVFLKVRNSLFFCAGLGVSLFELDDGCDH